MNAAQKRVYDAAVMWVTAPMHHHQTPEDTQALVAARETMRCAVDPVARVFAAIADAPGEASGIDDELRLHALQRFARAVEQDERAGGKRYRSTPEVVDLAVESLTELTNEVERLTRACEKLDPDGGREPGTKAVRR